MSDEFEKATPRPWRECGHGRGGCSCGTIWSIPADAPVVSVLGEHESVEDVRRPAEQQRENAALIVRAVNAFEPMRKALDMLSEQIKVRIDPGLLGELGRAGVGDITIRADVLLACLRALHAAEGEASDGR